MEFAERGKLVDETGEGFEGHKGERSVRRPILAELDRAHLAAQIALAHRLDLNVRRQFHTALPRHAYRTRQFEPRAVRAGAESERERGAAHRRYSRIGRKASA